MPNFSQRARELPESPIRKLAPFADAAKAAGANVFHLNIGQPDIETPAEYFEAIANQTSKVLAYSQSAGIEPLRQQIAAYYQRFGCDVQMEDVLVTTGASEAINFVLKTVLDPGEEIVIPEPFYANYLSFSLANDGVVVPVTSSIENDFALPTAAEFEAKITDKTRAIMICNPGNPTGILYPKSALVELLDLAIKHDLFLIADEVYREFVYDDEQHHSVLTLPNAQENTIVLDSISKRFSACGARIGNIVSKNAELLQMVLKMAQARLSPPTFGQIGATAVYQLPTSFYEGVNAEYQKRRDILLAALRDMRGVVCPNVNGAFYALVRLPVTDADHFCQWMLEEFRHEGSTVMMAPGSGFYATPGLGQNEVRIAYVLNEHDLKRAMECLAKGLEAYPNRSDR
jgi:aspartate aminotransferase